MCDIPEIGPKIWQYFFKRVQSQVLHYRHYYSFIFKTLKLRILKENVRLTMMVWIINIHVYSKWCWVEESHDDNTKTLIIFCEDDYELFFRVRVGKGFDFVASKRWRTLMYAVFLLFLWIFKWRVLYIVSYFWGKI